MFFQDPPTSIDAQSRIPLSSFPERLYQSPLSLADTQFYFGGGLRLNFSHEAVRAELLKVAIHWLHYVDGLYLTNLASAYFHSNLSGAYSRGTVFHDFLRKLRNSVNELNERKLPGKSKSRKILISSSDFVDPFLSGLMKRRRSQSRRRSSGMDHQLKPEFDDFDLDQSSLTHLDPTILANLHVMPFHTNQSVSTQSFASTTPSSRVKLKGSKLKARKLYSYFDLIHFELNLSPTETNTIRDQVNYVFLNRPADFPTILWSIGSIHRSRIADRLGEDRVLAGHFLLTMMPGTVSQLYGDEIALADVYETHTNNVSY